ncbi:MAG: response regulator, partial [Nitrospirae bacterium]|nr:response regulator [Nitrospirota bacterium]
MIKAKILIVEDEAIQAEILRRNLTHAGYDVSIAKDGYEALSLIPDIKPSIVISDILMPEMDGYEMCRQIKLNEETENTNVVLLTELKDPSDIIKGLEAKADSYITKPYDNAHLIQKIEYILNNKPVKIRKYPPPKHTIIFGNESHVITSTYQELFDLLIDTYKNVIEQNNELTKRTMELMKSEERFKFLV